MILLFDKFIKENIEDNGVILYHSTNYTWKKPEIKSLGFHAGTLKAAQDRMKSFEYKINPHIIKLKMNLKNPLYLGRDYRFHDNLSKVSTELYKDHIISKDERDDFTQVYSSEATFENLRNLLHKKYGYDGIIYRNNIEDRGSDSYIAFYPEQIEILDYNFNPKVLESLGNNVITLYHGQKGYNGKNKFDKPDFFIFPYFYLSPDIDYCLNYAVNKDSIHTFKIDTSNFVDLTSLHRKNRSEFLKLFLKLTGTYFPAELQNGISPEFWEIVRRDSKGYISKRLLSKGINGFKMMESYSHSLDLFTVYVILNNDPILEHN